MRRSYNVSKDLWLVRQGLDPVRGAKAVEVKTSHILVLDCSGSMSWDLPQMREQLKKRLPKLLKERDLLSIIWFSGKDQFGVLLEAEPVATLKDLADVNAAIDRWLKPICLTGFLQPLQEVSALVDRINKKHLGYAHALLFLSDGCDNQWNRQEILKATEETAGGLSSATFVEYGYYADRPLLTRMAEKAGGTLIFNEDFDRYAPTFEAAMQKTVSGAPRKEVLLKGDPIEGFAYALSDGDLIAYGVEGDSVAVSEDIDAIWYISPNSVGKPADFGFQTGPGPQTLGEIAKYVASGETFQAVAMDPVLAAAYAAVSLYAQRMKPNVVYALLKALGDVDFISTFSGCFGKQKYSEFMDQAKEAAFSTDGRFTQGWDPKKVPNDDAFTILDLLRILNDDDENRLLLDSDDFAYSRIGRGTVDASVWQMEELQEQIDVEQDDDKLKELKDELAALKKTPPLKFVADKEPNGYPVNALTLNESRPNISVLVKKEGTIDLSKRLKKAEHKKLPRKFPTYIHRNYAIVKDGLVNVKRLPVRMTKGTIMALKKAGFPMAAILPNKGETLEQTTTRLKKAAQGRPVKIVIDLRALPVINRQMVKDTSAEAVFKKTYEMMQAKAAQKVFNGVKKAEFPRESKGFKLVYGDEAATWLKDVGITDYNGFGPKVRQADARDYYMGKELKVKLKGLSSLPTLKVAQDKTASGKHTTGSALMAPSVKEVGTFKRSNAYKKAADQPQVFEAWLDGQLKASRGDARKLMFELAQIKFAVVVGQTWFTEFASLDANSLDIDVGGVKPLPCTVEMKEIRINI